MKIDVKHVAQLANLTLTQEEETKFEKQLSEVLEYISRLNEADTKGIDETSQVTGLENVTREDEAGLSLPQETALSQAGTTHNGFFKVKGVFDNE